MVVGNIIEQLALSIGVGEPALRLLLSILLGYPLAWIYRQFIFASSKLINHLFIITTGLIILYFNYGFDSYHVVLAIFIEYIFIHVLNGSVLTTVSFAFHLGYLLVGYYYTSSDTYDIKWTMPHCVLVLRLIGLSFDVADGQRPPEKLSNENKKTCLDKAPGLLEIYSFALFPASLLIGPQFPFRRYNSFMNKDFGRYTGNMRAGLIRGGIARQWDNFAGGDIYYYSNPNSPYPFTQDQIDAIHDYSISNLLCANSGMTKTAEIWPYAPTDDDGVNPFTTCDTFPPMDLSAWKVPCSD